MLTTLIAALSAEEREILAELSASIQFRRLEEIRRLLFLYTEQPPVGVFLDTIMSDADARRPAPAARQPTVIALRGERATA